VILFKTHKIHEILVFMMLLI